jgi:hypothetical protein
MRRRRIVVLAGAAALLLIPASLFWFRSQNPMHIADSFEVGDPAVPQHLLIATQGSPFKDALVQRIVQHVEPRSVYIKVIDVTALADVQEADWAAIVVIHTWENWNPQADAKAFLDRSRSPHKIIVVTTSGSGRETLPGLDAISAASVMREGPQTFNEVAKRIDALLAPR